VKKTEAIMEILAAYDLTQSFRDAAELTGARTIPSLAMSERAMRANCRPRRRSAVN